MPTDFENDFAPVSQTASANPLHELADRIVELRRLKEAKDAELKDIKRQLETVEAALVEKMVESESQRFDRRGQLFFITTTRHVSTKAGQAERVVQWLEDNGYGDLVKPGVHPSTLGGFVREMIDEAGGDTEALPGDLKPLLNVFEKPSIGVRKG